MARALRSWVFVPGNRQGFLDKIYELETPPDAVFFDLEDGVRPEVELGGGMERGAGLIRAPEIAAAHPQVIGLMFGAEDYALDLGLGTKREGEARELVYARSALVVAAAAARGGA